MLQEDQRKDEAVQQLDEDGRYRLGAAELLLGTKRSVLEGAVPPIPGMESASAATYGVVAKGLPVPATGGVYVAELIGKNELGLLAYVDPFGRAFSAREPSTVPPARLPDLSFAKLPERPVTGEELGCVYVQASDGTKREVAQYRCARGRYTLFDSWYDFGPYGANLSYDDAMARAYLAFVHRPSLGAPKVPERGLEGVHERLRGDKPLTAMRSIVQDARCAENDPVCRPPALVSCLARWLAEAGLDDVAGVKDEALRLVRTIRYANTYYLGIEDEDASVPVETVWALEAALNRFLLVGEAFGDRASLATDADCARWDAYLLETVATQHPAVGNLADSPTSSASAGEWDVRCALGAILERLRLPVRIDASIRCDVAAGAAAFELTVPSASLMPAWAWQEGSGWTKATDGERDAQAHRYALHLGLVLVAAAFDASPTMRRVDLVARPQTGATTFSTSENAGEFPQEPSGRAFVRTSFSREVYEAHGRFEDARAGDPMPPYLASGACFDAEGADAFAWLNEQESFELRRRMPEVVDGELTGAAKVELGADRCKDLRITFDAARRRTAEELADRIVRASSATDAIRIVRTAQEKATSKDDDRAVAACTRLMAALAEGEIDMGDQNAVVGRFLGDDRCLVALGRARTLAAGDPEAAVQVLVDAVSEATALDGFVDGATTVYRAFDSYASRVLYNRARLGAGAPARAFADAGKRVELVPDSYYLCHLEITQLLEHSFERTEEALRFGQRAIEIGPATAAGYRQLGRAYMLVGDMENAAAVLQDGLLIAVQPNDIAMAYYQLAYVLWKAGRPEAGAACYLKSLMTSSSMALQATAELQELVEETGVALPGKEAVDEALVEHAVPVAPTAEVLEALGSGAAAAVDAGLFPVARNLLALRLRYRPDDALVNVLRSLGE